MEYKPTPIDLRMEIEEMSQEKLAPLIGISVMTLSRVERSLPSRRRTKQKIAAYFGREIDNINW